MEVSTDDRIFCEDIQKEKRWDSDCEPCETFQEKRKSHKGSKSKYVDWRKEEYEVDIGKTICLV